MTVAFYVGSTGTGKTTLMCRHAMEKAGARSVPAILLDSEGVVGPDKWDAFEVKTLEELIEKVWKEGKHVRFHPSDPETVDRLCRIVRAGGDCVLAVDEVSYWARGSGLLPELARLYRVHRHSGVDLYATSQYPADVSPLVWNVKSEVFLFRNESSRAVERLKEECNLSEEEEEEVTSLPDMRYIPWRSAGGAGKLPSLPPRPAAPPPPEGAEAPPHFPLDTPTRSG